MKKLRTFVFFLLFAAALGLVGWQAFLFWQDFSIKEELAERASGMSRFTLNEGAAVNPNAYIAHGGGVEEFHYTNSREGALDALNKGMRLLELDLRITSDGHLVAVHDWKEMKRLAGLTDTSQDALSLERCRALRLRGKLHLLTAEDIRALMQSSPQLILVTDKIRDYDLLLREIPFPDRMIVEVFHLGDYRKALKSGIRYPAYQVSSSKELEKAMTLGMPIITLNAASMLNSPERIAQVRAAHASGKTILAYSAANSRESLKLFADEHLGHSVSMVYTDFLPDFLQKHP